MLVGLSLIALGIAAWQWQEQRRLVTAQSQPAVQFKPAADFRLTALDGQTVALRDLRGKVVLLNFWATWCPPCKAEMPDLNALYRDNGTKHNFVVIGVNVEEDRSAVEAFARQLDIAFPLLLDASGQVSDGSYHIRSLPTTLIVDRDGNVRDTWMGQIARPAMLARLERVW
jgi:peroxiredoxin